MIWTQVKKTLLKKLSKKKTKINKLNKIDRKMYYYKNI